MAASFVWNLLYFVEFYVILKLPSPFPPGREVKIMMAMISFALSVAAGIVSNYICKWLDELFKDGKH